MDREEPPIAQLHFSAWIARSVQCAAYYGVPLISWIVLTRRRRVSWRFVGRSSLPWLTALPLSVLVPRVVHGVRERGGRWQHSTYFMAAQVVSPPVVRPPHHGLAPRCVPWFVWDRPHFLDLRACDAGARLLIMDSLQCLPFVIRKDDIR